MLVSMPAASKILALISKRDQRLKRMLFWGVPRLQRVLNVLKKHDPGRVPPVPCPNEQTSTLLLHQ